MDHEGATSIHSNTIRSTSMNIYTKCVECNNTLSTIQIKKNRKFCSRSCSALHNNSNRVGTKLKLETIHKLQKSESPHRKLMEFKDSISGDYTKIYYNECKVCSKISPYKSYRKYCKEHESLLKRKREQYKFKFNVYDYPDLFNLDLLNEKGFYSPNDQWDKEGLSRDHKVSIAEAIENDYDPYYITHPLNCNLISQRDNAKKHSNSSISYRELVSLVDQY